MNKAKLKALWIDFLFWTGIRDQYEYCESCREEPKAFDDDYSSAHGLCAGCGAARAEAQAEMREDR